MAQKKLARFAAIKTFSNVLEYPTGMQGQWKTFFKNDNPIVLELACGKGEYTLGLARLYTHKNFIGVDIKGNRLFVGAKKAMEENITNAGFLRTQIEKLAEYFDPEEITDIWITFPDPHLRTSKAKKRLTHPKFLRLYNQILEKGGSIHLKTDSPDLFYFTKKVIKLYDLLLVDENDNIAASENVREELKIKTYYESLDIAQSNTIFYLQFQLPAVIKNMDDQLQQMLYEEKKVSGGY